MGQGILGKALMMRRMMRMMRGRRRKGREAAVWLLSTIIMIKYQYFYYHVGTPTSFLPRNCCLTFQILFRPPKNPLR